MAGRYRSLFDAASRHGDKDTAKDRQREREREREHISGIILSLISGTSAGVGRVLRRNAAGYVVSLVSARRYSHS